VKTIEKTKATPPPPPFVPSNSSSLPMSNHPLMKEINEWKIEHNR
jgi:hypothetical protein